MVRVRISFLLCIFCSLVTDKRNLGYVDPESDGGLDEDLAARRYRALLPDDDYDSDEY